MPTATKIDLEKVWGLRVRDRRQLLGLSQRALAELLDPPTTQQTIHKIEHGKITPRDSMKQRVAMALRCTPDQLFPWAEQLGRAS